MCGSPPHACTQMPAGVSQLGSFGKQPIRLPQLPSHLLRRVRSPLTRGHLLRHSGDRDPHHGWTRFRRSGMDGEASSRRLEGHCAWTTSSKKRIHHSAWKLHTEAVASPASRPSGLYGTFSTRRRRTTARHLVADPEAAARNHLPQSLADTGLESPQLDHLRAMADRARWRRRLRDARGPTEITLVHECA